MSCQVSSSLHELYPGEPMMRHYNGTRTNIPHHNSCVAKHLEKAHQQTIDAGHRLHNHALIHGGRKTLHHPAVAPDDVVDDPALAFGHSETGHSARGEHHSHRTKSGCPHSHTRAFPVHGYEGFEENEEVKESHLKEFIVFALIVLIIMLAIVTSSFM